MKKPFFLLLLMLAVSAKALPSAPLRIGALAYGTLNWELEVIEREGLARRQGFTLRRTSLANPQAGLVALQSGAVDLIVGSWLWTARQRALGQDFTAVPYSLTHGALIVPANSSIREVRDLIGKRLGIAGGPLYEEWLLLKALGKRQGVDLEQQTQVVFAAPPLLNEQLRLGRLDALLNFWHHAARLEAEGYKRLLDGGQLLQSLGVEPPVPILAYIFRQRWAQDHRREVLAFLRAVSEARNAICSDERVWGYLVPLTGSSDPKLLALLRQRYCAGRLTAWDEPERQAAARLYQLLKSEESPGELPAGTFWPDFTLPH
jgi:NitT/TauT family transport system substrate-binding protein